MLAGPFRAAQPPAFGPARLMLPVLCGPWVPAEHPLREIGERRLEDRPVEPLMRQYTCPKTHIVRETCQYITMGDVTSIRKLPKIELDACEGALRFARGGLRAAGVDVSLTDNRIVTVLTKLDARMARHLSGKEKASRPR